MKPTIIMESMSCSLGEYILVNVVNGQGAIGMCDTTRVPHTSRRTLYAEMQGLVSVYSGTYDDSANRQIWQNGSIDKCRKEIITRLTEACDNFFEHSEPLSKAIQPIMAMLTDGLYVVHADNAIPTDGAGNFFWNSYHVKHELNGSAPFNPVIGHEKEFSPPFLVPTLNYGAYSDKALSAALKRVKHGRKTGGIAYHLTGMFSALLCGHIDAAAAAAYGSEFPCIMIEPLRDVAYSTDENGNESISILTCPYAKLPINKISRGMIEAFLLNRRVSMPEFRGELCEKADKLITVKHAVKSLPTTITQNSEQFPDAEMLSSAFAISALSDEQLQLLIDGETTFEGKYIVSANYYESVVYACNYLQYKDKQRFISFTIALLNTPSLAPTYRYIAERMQYVTDVRIKDAFANVIVSDEPAYQPIKEIAQKYIERFENDNEQGVNALIKANEETAEAESSAPTNKITAAKAEVDEARENDGFSSLKIQQAMSNTPAPAGA